MIRLLIVTIIGAGLMVISCMAELSKITIDKTISPDKYVFIEHHVHTHVKAVEGDYRGLIIDSPTYSFNEKAGTLRGIINFDVNDALKIVYGSGSSLTGVAGGGINTMLYGVYEFPYQHGEIAILGMEPDGTVQLVYQGNHIILKSGEEWINIASRTDVQRFGNKTAIAYLTITDRITNYGILYKSKIAKYLRGEDGSSLKEGFSKDF